MSNQYETVTNEFFSKMENEIADIEKKRKITNIVTASTLGVGVLSMVISSAVSSASDFFAMTGLVLLFAGMIALAVSRSFL